MTDPLFTGYVNADGNENSDLCNSELGDVRVTDKTLWNIQVNGQNYLISSQFNLKTGVCDMGTGSPSLSVTGPLSQWSTTQNTTPHAQYSEPPPPSSPQALSQAPRKSSSSSSSAILLGLALLCLVG